MEGPPTEHPNAELIRRLYEARNRDDLDTVRSMLAEDVVWHEPDVGGEHAGDLRGPDAVLAMIRGARELTSGSFRLRPQAVVANGEHAVALIDWSATRPGGALNGKEVAVYRVRDGKIAEASFHQDDLESDRRFWE